MVHAWPRGIANKSPQHLYLESKSPRHCKWPLASLPKTSLKVIECLKEAGKETHLKATNTKKCYAGHVKHGHEWHTKYYNGTTPSTDLEWLSSEWAQVSQDDPDPYFSPAFLVLLTTCWMNLQQGSLTVFDLQGVSSGAGKKYSQGHTSCIQGHVGPSVSHSMILILMSTNLWIVIVVAATAESGTIIH